MPHDMDRTLLEFESDESQFGEDEALGEGAEVFGEDEVEMLAAELLSVSNERELDHFFGDLIKKAGGALKQFAGSSLGKQLGGVLKGAAKTALPMLGGALGNLVLPGIGGAIGSKLASSAGSMFGLELEGLSLEDQQFEVAKQFVRLAGDATKNAVQSPSSQNPAMVARSAVSQAASKYAPGLTSGAQRMGPVSSGRWIRRGNRIILFGV